MVETEKLHCYDLERSLLMYFGGQYQVITFSFEDVMYHFTYHRVINLVQSLYLVNVISSYRYQHPPDEITFQIIFTSFAWTCTTKRIIQIQTH